MLEVVFSDSVAGAMLVAIGHQHSVGGATAVIFANEDGEQNATIPQAEIEKFQREAEERERRGWENAVPFEGKRENIVYESADLLYHLTVLLQNEGLQLADVVQRLRERHHAA